MNAYHGWIDEDVVNHISKVLEMVDLIYVPGLDSHQLRMKVFPLSLADDAKQWWINVGEEKLPFGKNSSRSFYRRCKAEKFEAIQYSLGPNEEYIAIRSYEYDIWERNKDNLLIIYQDIFQKKDEGWKVTVTDLFYLRGMDVESVNVPYLLSMYLRLFAAGRKSEAHISGEQFFDDTWAWVAIRPERQPDDAASAPVVAKDAPAVEKGDQVVPAPVQAPQQPPPPPPASARTMPQRLGRLEEDV
ncbi:hypothetical protein Tco_1454665 [Tanacetum coccineum]